MGSKPAKSAKKLKKTELDLSCDLLMQQLTNTKSQKQHEISEKEQQLKISISESWRTEKDVFVDIINLAAENKQLSAFNILQRYSMTLKAGSDRIIKASRANDFRNMVETEVILQGLIWSAGQLDLDYLRDFCGFIKSCLGGEVYSSLGSFDKVDKELRDCLGRVEPCPLEIMQYLTVFSNRQKISGLIAQGSRSEVPIHQQTIIELPNEESEVSFKQSITPTFKSIAYDSNEDALGRNKLRHYQSKSEIINIPQPSYVNDKFKVQPLSFIRDLPGESRNPKPQTPILHSINPSKSQIHHSNLSNSQNLPQPSIITPKDPQTELKLTDDYINNMIGSIINKSSFRS